MTMRIVFVCTTNVWGSAMAELISRQLLAELDPNREQIEVYSVGVRAEVGAAMPAVAQQVLGERGIDASEHRARWMSPTVLEGADLTLAMGEIQRNAALALNPRGLRSTFTVHEAAGLLQSLAPMVAPIAPESDRRSPVAVAAMAGARRFRSVSSGADDLPDLLADDVRVVRALADQLTGDVTALVRALMLSEFAAPQATPSQRASAISLVTAVA